ncbi:hypothetical protein BS47DRAFT_1396439 [Hydnum rufescens UP504]|uniref:Uncharacterized protein n=1 Tax=Hydnum rufescens UP504 TaxID=1448309 RepID=A0A9P6AQP1_9AGAM|nr:hypothetical protein BS47DRAFT_1396439 [Hydnum rufescens UP504]
MREISREDRRQGQPWARLFWAYRIVLLRPWYTLGYDAGYYGCLDPQVFSAGIYVNHAVFSNDPMGFHQCYATENCLQGIPRRDGVHQGDDLLKSTVSPPPPPLSTFTYITLIGHANTSLNVARLLLSDADKLSPLDIPVEVIDGIKSSSTRHIDIVSQDVGRPQVSFKSKGLCELLNLPAASIDPISS